MVKPLQIEAVLFFTQLMLYFLLCTPVKNLFFNTAAKIFPISPFFPLTIFTTKFSSNRFARIELQLFEIK